MKFLILLVTLSTGFAFAAKPDHSQLQACIDRIPCDLSKNNMKKIHHNVEICDQVVSKSGKTSLELFLLKDSDKIVVVKTKGPGVDVSKNICPMIKYPLGNGYSAKDFTVIDNKVWIETHNRALFVMMPDQAIYHLTAPGIDGYVHDVEADVKWNSHTHKTIETGDARIKRGFMQKDIVVDGKMLNDMLSHNARRIKYTLITTHESLFNDK